MPIDESWLWGRIAIWVPLVLSLSVHEWAHAWSAHRLGDPTAAEQGRMTLNPLEHMDPIGSFLLPLLGVPFGWAKPVPVNPARFRGSIDEGLVLTALAGPISNLALAMASTAVVMALAGSGVPAEGAGRAVYQLLEMMLVLNLLLAFFNLLPIPPLDGGRIVDGIVPDGLRPAWDTFASVGPVVLGAVIVVPLLLGISLISWPLDVASMLFESAFAAVGAAPSPAH